MEAVKAFGDRLKHLRETTTHPMTQAQLAGKLGVSRASVGFYEKGERTPDITFLVLAADYFHVSYDYLLGQSDNKQRENIDIGEKLGFSDSTLESFERIAWNAFGNSSLFNHLFDHGFEIVLTDLMDLVRQYCAAKEKEARASNEQKTLNSFRESDVRPALDENGNPIPGLFNAYMTTDTFLDLKLQQINNSLNLLVKRMVEYEMEKRRAVDDGNSETEGT